MSERPPTDPLKASGSTATDEHDDFSLVRVPESARYGWVSVAMQRFGMLSALAQFMLAASIGALAVRFVLSFLVRIP
ncbi:hypothetical protein [Austwickia sp. TVS 96-490-7B]|uniref:hypothetical protein n=1 Tax=Austwickia sp. TVS 96-490-7B TaxID=2830843 RepID=UPI001C589A1E|nr:hypothetical protein [Austwickia sp. TVS 96-490-7B]